MMSLILPSWLPCQLSDHFSFSFTAGSLSPSPEEGSPGARLGLPPLGLPLWTLTVFAGRKRSIRASASCSGWDDGYGPGDEKVTLDHPGGPIQSRTSLHMEKLPWLKAQGESATWRQKAREMAALKREGGAVGSRKTQPCKHLEFSPVRPALDP